MEGTPAEEQGHPSKAASSAKGEAEAEENEKRNHNGTAHDDHFDHHHDSHDDHFNPPGGNFPLRCWAFREASLIYLLLHLFTIFLSYPLRTLKFSFFICK